MKLAAAAFSTSLAICLSAGPAAAQTIPVPPSTSGYQPVGKDERGLWEQASEAERDFKASRLVIRDPGVNAYLRDVLCRTVGSDHCGAVRIYLVRSPIFNAFMMPNGAMVVFSGALLRIRDEAELSAILGHEFTHFEHRHSLAGLKSQRAASNWGAWLTMISLGVGSGYNYSPIFAAGHAGFARDQERDADLSSVTLMYRGGFRPRSASQIWAAMRREEDNRAAALGVKSLKDAWRGPFATHPMDAERMTYLAAAAEKMGDDVDYTGVEQYRAALAPIWPMLIADQIKLNDFGGSEFLLGNLAGGGWQGHLLYARGELYRTRSGPGDLDAAIGYFREASLAADAPAETWRGLGLASAKRGDGAGARAAIAEYLRRRPDAGDRAVLEQVGEGQ